MFRKTLVGVIAATVWLANPMLGCNSSGEDEFTFGEVEMRVAVKGTYSGQLAATGETITLELDEATRAPNGTTTTQSTKRVQCGTRSFVRSAAACASMTEMELDGSITSSGPTIASGDLKAGRFVSGGRLLDHSQLSLTLPDSSSVTATYLEARGMTDWLLTTADGQKLPLELERIE